MVTNPYEGAVDKLNFPGLVREQLIGLGSNRMTVYRGELLSGIDGLTEFISVHTAMSPLDKRYIMGVTTADNGFCITSNLLEGGFNGHAYLESFLPETYSGEGTVRFMLAQYKFSPTEHLNYVKVNQWTGKRAPALYIAEHIIRSAPEVYSDLALNILLDNGYIDGTIAQARVLLDQGKSITQCYTEHWTPK